MDGCGEKEGRGRGGKTISRSTSGEDDNISKGRARGRDEECVGEAGSERTAPAKGHGRAMTSDESGRERKSIELKQMERGDGHTQAS
jgi:hypothetical protein